MMSSSWMVALARPRRSCLDPMSATPTDPASDLPPAHGLPAGYRPGPVLAEHEGVVVLRAVDPAGRAVVLRLERAASSSPEALAELAVLGAVDHPALARLLDFGALPGGGRFTARAFVEGATLDAWAAGRESREVGLLVLELCDALAHLHGRGFVHGDLKPQNVLVSRADRPVLVDFGLAGRRGGGPGASGTLVAMAPERIAGAPLEPAADLFALGALLVELFAGRPDPGRFYAAFPRRPFLEAAGVAPDALPEWARDVIERTTARDPDERPAHAGEVARTVAARLGVERGRERDALAAALAPPIHLGRERALERLVGTLTGSAPACSFVSFVVLPSAEDAPSFARRLRLEAALAGAPCAGATLDGSVVDGPSVDDSSGAGPSGAGADHESWALDRWARERARSGDGPLVIAVATDDAWERRRAETLVRAAQQEGRRAIAVAGARPRDAALAALEIDGPRREDLDAFVRARLEGDPQDLGGLLEHLEAACGASTVAIGRELARLERRGCFLDAGERPRLRAGALADGAGIDGGDGALVEGLDDDAGRVLIALAACGSASIATVAAALASDAPSSERDAAARDAAARLAALERKGLVGRQGTRFTTRVATAPLVRAVGVESARAVVARVVARARNGERSLLEGLVDPDTAGDALLDTELDALDRGAAEVVLARLDRLERLVALAEPLSAARRAPLRALALVALGQLERARDELERAGEALAATHDPRAKSLAERARGLIAQRGGEPELALEHFDRAARLDANERAHAEVARLHQLFELRRHDEVLERVQELDGQGVLEPGGWPAARRANARSLDALARFAKGDAEDALGRLEALAVALEDEPATRAAVLLNLATVVRRVRGPESALAHLREAVALLDAAHRPVEAAQARTALASTLRDTGELVVAEQELAEACATRERLGDRGGAAIARGTLGLVLADRGHVLRALAELDAALRDLAPLARRRHGALLEARRVELAARLGREVDLAAAEAPAIDPREFLSLGRAAHLAGRPALGDDLIARAIALAERLEQHPVAAQARSARALVQATAFDPKHDAAHDADLAVARTVLGEVDDDAHDLLVALERSGRDDRAARLALVLAREARGERRADLLATARRLAGRCEAGLDQRERIELRRTLLGVPDPRPDDLDALADEGTEPELEDMELLSILEINRRLATREDHRELLGEIVEQALEVTGGERGFLVLEEGGELLFDTALDSARGDVERPQIEVSTSVVRAALDRGEVLRVSNAAEEPGLQAAPSVVQLDLRSILCAPFEIDADARGAIYVDHRLHAGAFGPRAERLLKLLADQAALAIQKVRRLDEIRRLNERLTERVSRQATDLAAARRSLRAVGLPAPAGGLVGESESMLAVRALIERVAASDLSVLVHGASGTGKELAARALHELSDRREGPFVSENCASLPESLIESELFGYEKGAFTGADRAREGLFERANGGTLFLDEIGEMPSELQSKLLRAIETREIRRLGDDRPRPVDVRLVTATNRDLETEVRERRFREDLYYRIAGMKVKMPALDERIDDVGLLVRHFLDEVERKDGRHREIAPAVIARLARRTWPGNVRELRNEVARLCILSEGDIVDPELVSMPGPSAAGARSVTTGELRSFAEIERDAILGTLDRVGGDKRRAAKVLGISLSKLYERLKKWREEDASV